MDMRKLIEKGISVDSEEFYLVESDLFMEFSKAIPHNSIMPKAEPVCAAFAALRLGFFQPCFVSAPYFMSEK